MSKIFVFQMAMKMHKTYLNFELITISNNLYNIEFFYCKIRQRRNMQHILKNKKKYGIFII